MRRDLLRKYNFVPSQQQELPSPPPHHQPQPQPPPPPPPPLLSPCFTKQQHFYLNYDSYPMELRKQLHLFHLHKNGLLQQQQQQQQRQNQNHHHLQAEQRSPRLLNNGSSDAADLRAEENDHQRENAKETKSFTCGICDRADFGSEMEALNHRKVCHSVKTGVSLRCAYCNADFRSR